MTVASTAQRTSTASACAGCLRRSWLLGALSPVLDYAARNPGRLIELLALPDEQLLRALAGQRMRELENQYQQFDPRRLARAQHVEALCRHDRSYPDALRGEAAPRMMNVAGGAQRLAELSSRAVVAIIGTRHATDYGVEVAKSLARGLGASGVTVASGLTDGIAAAAQAGALEAGARTVLAMSGGADVCAPAKRRSLYEHVLEHGCAVAELPCGSPARRWGQLASERLLASFAELTVVVEAEESSRELASAQLARALGRTLAAVPGRVTSAPSRGTHALLIDGAHLVRGPSDVLELLHDAGGLQAHAVSGAQFELEPRLRAVLELVGAGRDTPGRLAGAAGDAAETLLALSELELMGVLARGDGGRYVPREPLASASVRYRVNRQMEP